MQSVVSRASPTLRRRAYSTARTASDGARAAPRLWQGGRVGVWREHGGTSVKSSAKVRTHMSQMSKKCAGRGAEYHGGGASLWPRLMFVAAGVVRWRS